MSPPFVPLTAPQAVAAAHRIFERADKALSLARALDGVPHRDLLSIVILARQLDAIARAAASSAVAPDQAAFTQSSWEVARSEELREQLTAAGYLPLPTTLQHEEPAHGEG